MSDQPEKQRSKADEELQREIREGRRFSLEEAIGRMAGGGAMKGQSPIPQKQQAALEIETWLRLNVSAAADELQIVLFRRIKGSEILLRDSEKPLSVIAAYCRQVLDSDYMLQELVREADVEWGRVQHERPYFEQDGKPCDPADPYTFASVRTTLESLMEKLGTLTP